MCRYGFQRFAVDSTWGRGSNDSTQTSCNNVIPYGISLILTPYIPENWLEIGMFELIWGIRRRILTIVWRVYSLENVYSCVFRALSPH